MNLKQEETRRKAGPGIRCETTAENKKNAKNSNACIARSCIRNSRCNVAVCIDDYDDITLIWLFCIIRGIELAKDSPTKKVEGGG